MANAQLGTDSSVYGPVRSWRYGLSLGIDPILARSTCSFDCVYCQLGSIVDRTLERRIHVPTARVLEDLAAFEGSSCDVLTVSGSGEPTLAANLGELLAGIRRRIDRPVVVLTNGTLLVRSEVRHELETADVVSVKLDAATEDTFQRISRPVAGVTLAGVLEGLRVFRRSFPNRLHVQTMILPANRREAEAIARLVRSIAPDEVELNAPVRPRPLAWHPVSRGSHDGAPYPARSLRTLPDDEMERLARVFRSVSGSRVSLRPARPAAGADSFQYHSDH